METLALRSLVIAVPIALVMAQRRGRFEVARCAFAGLLAYQIITVPWSSMKVGWGSLTREPNADAAAAADSPSFQSGKTYRVLSQADGKYAPYAVVRAGGRLDSEFFPESMYWRSFKDQADYAKFLNDRHIDEVVYYHRYSRRKTNEQAMLQSFEGRCEHGVSVERTEQHAAYDFSADPRGC